MWALLLACAPAPQAPVPDAPAPADPFAWPDVAVEQAPDAPEVPHPVYDPLRILDFDIALPQSSVDALALDPFAWVPGDFTFEGRTWARVGVRLKGHSSYQWLNRKPPLKVKFHEYVDGQRFYGLERLTLNNNVHDPSMMAETLAYRLYREAGSPSPRTGYARVSLNGQPLGLYTIVESTDDDFIDAAWPGSAGSLYEPVRGCDLDEDPACYELEQAGDGWLEGELDAVHAAALDPDFAALRAHLDLPRVLAFLAVERFTAHQDSYSFNDNNSHLFYEPATAQVSLVPWGADSTFVYRYPTDQLDYPCESRQHTLDVADRGLIAWRCRADTACSEALDEAMLEVADLSEAMDLAGFATQVADVIREDATHEPRTFYEPAHFEQRLACHLAWIRARPAVVRAAVGG